AAARTPGCSPTNRRTDCQSVLQNGTIAMLSRVADALFWMSRYLERAEHIARLLDIGFHLELDLRGVLAGPRELHWTSLAAILQRRRRVAARFLSSGPVRQSPVSRRLRCPHDARRGLAVHSTRQTPGTRRQDAAHSRHPVSRPPRADRPRRTIALQLALGRRAARLPRLPGLPDGLRRPRRSGARGRFPSP